MGEAVTNAVTSIEALGPEILAIGGAIIGLAVIAMGIRWVKATFF